jgi:hypothetical protein
MKKSELRQLIREELENPQPNTPPSYDNSEGLRSFLKRVDELVDEFHHDIYLIKGVTRAIMDLEVAVLDELNKDLPF